MADTEKTDPADKPKSGVLLSLIKIGVFVGVVVVVEVVAAAMMLPSAQDIERTARELAAARDGNAASDSALNLDSEVRDSGVPTVEMRLGLFNVTRYNPEKDTTMIIDFEVFGVVEAGDDGAFEQQFGKHEIRIREQIIMTLQAAEATDLRGEGLGLIKRRLLEKTNRALGRPLVREVVFSKFNFVER